MSGTYTLSLGGSASNSWSSGYTVGRRGSFSKEIHLRSIGFVPVGSGFSGHAFVRDPSGNVVANGPMTAVTSGGSNFDLPIDVVLAAGTTYVIGVYYAGSVKVATTGYGTYNSAPAFCSWSDGAAVLYYGSGDGNPGAGQTGNMLPLVVGFDSTNAAPNAPLWTTPNDQTVAANEDNTLTWAFSDPNPGDTQSAYTLKRWTLDANGSRVGAPVTTYAATPLSQHTIQAGTLTAGTKYEFQVDTFDSRGVEGPYSASLFLTAGTRPSAPTWLDPTNGQTIGLSSYTGTISAPNVDASEWTLYADNAGSIDTATILQGPVTKTTGDLRSHTWTGLANNTTVWWSVRIKDDGLWSQPAQIRTPVSYTPPVEPTATLSTDPNTGALLVAITNPVPGAGEPGVTHNVVKADDGDGKGFTTRYGSSMVTPNSTWVYHLAKGDRDYSGSIQVTAVGDNGTTSTVTIT